MGVLHVISVGLFRAKDSLNNRTEKLVIRSCSVYDWWLSEHECVLIAVHVRVRR